MKKILALLLVLVMGLTLFVGCTKDEAADIEENQEQIEEPAVEEEVEEVEVEEEAEETEEPALEEEAEAAEGEVEEETEEK